MIVTCFARAYQVMNMDIDSRYVGFRKITDWSARSSRAGRDIPSPVATGEGKGEGAPIL